MGGFAWGDEEDEDEEGEAPIPMHFSSPRKEALMPSVGQPELW